MRHYLIIMPDFKSIYHHFKNGRMRPFYTAMYPGLLLYASRILGQRLAYMAEDCVQTAVINTYIRRAEISDEQKWRAWLLTAVRNNALMQLRSDEYRREFETSSMLSENEAEDVSLALIEQEVYSRLFSAVDSLPEKYRQIFRMSFEEGMKISQIAEELNVAEITVKKRKARLIELLRERLGNNIDEAYIILLLSTLRVVESL